MPSVELPTWTAFADYLAAGDLALPSSTFFVVTFVLMVAIAAAVRRAETV